MNSWLAFSFGIIVAIAVGPIAMLIVQKGVTKGFQSALLAGLGAATGDFLYGVIAFTVGGALAVWLNEWRSFVEIFAGLLLVIIGLTLVGRAVSSYYRRCGLRPVEGRRGGDFWQILLLTLANPLTVLIFLCFASRIDEAVSFAGATHLALFVFLGSLLVQTAIAGLSAISRNFFRTPARVLFLNIVSGLGIAGFGLNYFF